MKPDDKITYDDKTLLSERNLRIVKEFRLIDDTFFAVCFDNDTELTEFVLRILLDKEDLHVTEVKTQYSIKGLGGHSALLDAFASDSSGRHYNIEIQRDEDGAIPQRARYYGGLIDSHSLKKGEKYKDLTETYVIFITENDVLGDNLPIYHIERIITETNKPFNDGMHIVYVNASYIDNTPLGKLMQDFMSANPYKMNYASLSRKTQYFKENEKGVAHMCKLIKDAVEEETRILQAQLATKDELLATKDEQLATKDEQLATKNEQLATKEEQLATKDEQLAKAKAEKDSIALRLLNRGFSIEQTSDITGLSAEAVRQIINA